ncbi:hypothetical protein CA13_23470 [Planctomycetes bacterium CA13]|uniref:Periplasmic folding chaperone n=1 Tax=Novipirellula herctigrandis TaxID=2527986 RepID=A0A5C5Z244_9BACT|nr:hypothetical protein CA13_23470 [Planctomycetes bacterium CA13]
MQETAEEEMIEEPATEEAKPEEPATEEAKPEEPATEEAKPEEPATEEAKPEEPATDQVMDEQASTDSETATSDQTEEAEPEAESKVESFEDVREQIANSLAQPIAMERMNSAVIELDSKMRRYFNMKAIYESNKSIGQDVQPPEALDLKALGESLGFRYEKMGPHTEVTIEAEPIANSLEVGSLQMRRGPAFVTMMYGGASQQGQAVPRQELYSPLRTADDRAGRIYVSWKTSESEAYTPKLEEVREEVIAEIRMQEARKLAVAAAEKIAAAANEGEGKDLADAVPADKKDQVQTGLGPFSWLDSFGFQGASIGNVPELDSVGEAFMKTVFTTDVGKSGVALNQPERVVYVVKPTGFQPDTDMLKSRFKEPRDRMMALLAGGGSANDVLTGFYKSVDERTGFSFLRDDEDQ